MVGEDAVSVYTQLLMKFIDLLAKIGEEHRRNKQNKQPAKPKIRQGNLSKADFNKLMKKGVDFKFIPIPKEKEAEVEERIKRLHGSFFKAADPDNANSLFAVPTHQLDLMQSAIKQTLSNIIKEDPSAIQVKDGTARISPEDMPLVSDVLRRYDIPVYSFKGEDGMYTNIVPTEYEGQYKKAMAQAMRMKEQLANIDVHTFEMNGTLEMPDTIAKVIPAEEAAAVNAGAQSRGLAIEFAKNGDETVILYPSFQKERAEKLIQECREIADESDKYDITVNDNSVSIDKSTLLKEENEREYFVRVPNTHGMDYIRIDKNYVTETNGEKTIVTKLDPGRSYPIFDTDGNFAAQRQGSELLKLYDVKHKGINKDTVIAEYGNRVNKIELFNNEQNKLISVGIDSCERIREELMEQGISDKTADSLLARMNDILSKNDDLAAYRSIFNYTVENPVVVYADVPNIGDRLAQTQLSELLVGKADMVGEIPPDEGKCCCFYDKTANKYTIVSADDRGTAVSRLTEMGYSAALAEHLADKCVTGIDPQDIEELPYHFDSSNSELENVTYTMCRDNTFIIADNADSVKYMCIDKGAAAADVEAALCGDFGIKDKMSAAVILKELSEKGAIEELPKQTIDGFEITKISSDMIEVTNKNGFMAEPALMRIDRINHEKLSDMGADERTIRSIEKSFEKSAEEFGKVDKLSNLRKFAENAIHNVGQAVEKVGQVISKADVSIHGDER
ncbi:MAG: hypothetical protein J6N70_07800 [Oribacterium sp.]|nr:hypothetical protein [Oribacterium sp.]